MKTLKILGILLITLTGVLGCENMGGGLWVSREKMEQAEAENQRLAASMDSLQRDYAHQAEELAAILSDIAELGNRTSRIRVDAPGEKPLSQVESARADLKAIRERIDGLEKEVEAAKASKNQVAISAKTISQLRATLDLKEKEIYQLQLKIREKESLIREKEETISVQKDTISRQMKELQAQKKELQRQVQAQIELLYRAGNRFLEIADEGDFKVTGRRNKMNVKQYRISIYGEALDLFEAAAEQGHAAARDSVVSTRRKINELIASKK